MISIDLTYQRLLRVIAFWAIGGVLLAVFERPLSDYLWIGILLLTIPYAVAGIVFLLTALWKAWHSRRDARKARGFLLAAGAVIAVAVALMVTGEYLMASGNEAAVRLRFARHRRAYELIVARVLADTAKHWADSAMVRDGYTGLLYEVDSGPPIRVAFPQPGGILDNWEGIIYDPSGVIKAARGWRFDNGSQEFSAPPAIRTLFGGDIVICSSLQNSWYVCSFT